ncbi:purine-nucleoside phosphorylase [bacterium]|nr:purine-nucleoside phosphorylase [bacterium]
MQSAVDYINEKTNNFQPEIGVILGSGLGDFVDNLDKISISYGDIPGFQKSNVQGHAGKLVFAEYKGKRVVFMQGRYHFYEGHSMQTVTYPVKVMKKLGVKTLIVTNAAGAVNENFNPADLMIITDHINFLGTNPLIGPNDDSLGTRFPDMSEVYKKDLVAKAESCAEELGINIRKGVYLASTGPSYETPTEVRMMRMMGADAVGMSTVPEAIVANYCGIKVLGISCLTNYASGITDTPLTHKEVIEAAAVAKENFQALLGKVLEAV